MSPKKPQKRQKRASFSNRGTEKAQRVAASGKVGKGEPPEAFKWRPGQSGNPSGKPSAHREVMVQAVKDMLAQVDPKLNKSLFERLLEQCARRALQGSKWHMGVLLDYGLGKPMQAVNLTGTLNYTDALTKIRQRVGEHRTKAPPLPSATPGNGESDAETAQVAAATPEQDTARPGIEQGPVKRVVV